MTEKLDAGILSGCVSMTRTPVMALRLSPATSSNPFGITHESWTAKTKSSPLIIAHCTLKTAHCTLNTKKKKLNATNRAHAKLQRRPLTKR
jgi:hypothetical protein